MSVVKTMPDPHSKNEQTAMIGIGEYRVGSFPMMTIGLGSCIGLTLYDDSLKVGAMVHIMLPESAGRTDRPGKYADTAVPTIIKELNAMGCKNRSLVAKMAGGAAMFEYFGANLNIGERNAIKVRSSPGRTPYPRGQGRCRWQRRAIGDVPPCKQRQVQHPESRWHNGRTLTFFYSASLSLRSRYLQICRTRRGDAYFF